MILNTSIANFQNTEIVELQSSPAIESLYASTSYRP